MSQSAGITGIGQVAYSVKDLDASTAFYRDVVGLRFLFSAPPGMSFFACGDARILLAKEEASGVAPGSLFVYYKTDDIEAAAAHLAANGATLEQKPHFVADLGDRVLWLAVFKDPDGYLQHLMSEVPKG
ncbi:MAG TPA: VOC family protein [Thermoanaerobaculia bacterium]|nr:VOC family protein [Thermoanaerobaculia bacterium]